MSEKRRPPPSKHFRVIEDITDQDELDRLSALRPPVDFGAASMVSEVAGILYEREKRGVPASAIPHILGLLELLTPEQQLDLARRLPPLLSPEARAVLATAPAPAGANGVH